MLPALPLQRLPLSPLLRLAPLPCRWGYANRTDAFSSREDCMKCAVPWKDDADCPNPPPPAPPVSL